MIKRAHIRLLYSVVFVFLFFTVSLINTFHESYPDEFDNILGGRYLLEGKRIYSDFFTHHGPVAYYIAALPQLVVHNSFVLFRVVYALLLSLYLLWTYRFIARRFSHSFSNLYLLFIIFLNFSLTYYWGHMLLADSIAALFFLPVFVYCIGNSFETISITRKDLFVISCLLFLGLFSSLTFVFVVLIFYSYLLFLYYRNNPAGKLLILRTFLLYTSIPYLIFLLIFLMQGNLNEFYKQAIEFNQRYYLYNYPRPEGSSQFNPVRYAVVIAYAFFNQIYALLTQITRVNIQYPVNITLAVGFMSFVIYLFFYRRYLLALFVIGVLTYANVRSAPLSSSPPDYQIAVYFVLSLFTSFVFLRTVFDSIHRSSQVAKRSVLQGLFLASSFLMFFTSAHLFKQFADKAYGKYMGTSPLIYDRPELAPILNAATQNTESAWIGPFAFEDLWYMRAQTPSRYHILIPAMKKTGYIDHVAQDLRKKRPTAVYFDRNFFILGTKTETYSEPVLSVLDSDYDRYLEYRDNGKKYISVKPITLKVDVEAKLYIRKDQIQVVTERLLKAKIIRTVPESY